MGGEDGKHIPQNRKKQLSEIKRIKCAWPKTTIRTHASVVPMSGRSRDEKETSEGRRNARKRTCSARGPFYRPSGFEGRKHANRLFTRDRGDVGEARHKENGVSETRYVDAETPITKLWES